jgi:hypothetical protein
MRRKLAVLLFAVLPLSALAQTPPPRLTSEQQSLWNAYFRAIYDSAVYQPENVRPLYPLRPDVDGNVLVATLGRRDGNVGDTISSTGQGIWVTMVPEVQTICRAFTGDVALQLRELLGLRPDDDVPRFLILQAKASEIFRPSPYPQTTTIYPCPTPPDSTCGNVFPTDPAVATPAHVLWIASASFSLHAIPGGYPWTHLGYTYNWAPGKDRYGASEYVIRAGSTATIREKWTPAEYCAPAKP